ncbi:MAG TPA: glutamyl-tRNA reductase [Acidimicrobiales bacterium]|nr:glutamyl-tRNA reductase [Acidimicrobiales bacterium]
MAVVVVGLNTRTLPLEILERMTVGDAQLPKAADDLLGRENLTEAVVLSTCMRTEIYASAARFHGAMSDIRNFLAEWSGTEPEAFGDHLYSYYEDAAVTHLFRVAAGIDSAVIGEGEVLRQVRHAYDAARTAGAAGPVLTRLFRHATEVGKRARHETAITRGITSLSQAAVAMAGERLGSLEGRTVLLLGAGEMGEGMAQALAAVPGIGRTLVANRTWAKATQLATRIGATPVELGGLGGALEEADVLLTSTGAPGVLIDADDLEPVLPARGGRPLLVVDIAVPRDVDVSVGQLPGVTLLNMDDLKAFVDAAMAGRRKEIPAVSRIIAEEAERFADISAAREMAPLVAALRDRLDTVRAAEMDRYRSRLSDLTDGQRADVDALTRSLLAKVLHEPTVQLKDAAGSVQGEQLAEAVRVLFNL